MEKNPKSLILCKIEKKIIQKFITGPLQVEITDYKKFFRNGFCYIFEYLTNDFTSPINLLHLDGNQFREVNILQYGTQIL